ncbi:MAG TPA: M64 family metallopeptidase [Bacteroidota bacterium]|nr:M64 family metallopeptidase [Bacteroidota bacterium]
MNHRYTFFFLFCLSTFVIFSSASAQTFDKYFHDQTMRIDLYHAGTKGTETLSLDKVYVEGAWPGSIINLLDTLNLGEYIVRVYDRQSGSLIYSRGYSCLFNEWQTTDEALAGVYRTFHETVRIPYPERPIQVTISKRDKYMDFHEMFSTAIDPNSPTEIHREKFTPQFKVVPLVEKGSPHEKVDILVLGDGYRKEDLPKFRNDAKHFNDVMFSTSPFKERKDDFNVWTIEVISPDSGIDKPDKNIWKRTALGTQYNSFGSARYVLTDENRALRDIAGAAPYDFIIILVNDDRYGGGGIYNLYSTCYANPDNPSQAWERDYVYVHEFGHSFAGLGDEYYSSQVSYTDFYPKGVEPWEPNLTALTDKEHLKWKKFVSDGIAIPTPWDKSTYDSLTGEQRKLDRLASDYYAKREPLYQAEEKVLRNPSLAGKVGAFEGAGYSATGIYRPSLDCRMFSLSLVGFDPVCSDAISREIDFYAH